MATYSLSRYILSIKFPEELSIYLGRQLGVAEVISIGGEGSYLNSFSFEQSNNTYSVEGDATGSYVVNKSLDKTGTASITINQMSDKIAKFKKLAQLYYQNEWESGLTLTLTKFDNSNEVVVSCSDCYITKIPNQEFQDTAQDQTWSFVVGKIDL